MSIAENSGGGKAPNRENRIESHPYHRPAFKDDLYCVHCGYIIRNGRIRKLASCPNIDCRKFLPLTSGYGYEGWGRCLAPSCWRFTNRDYCYCESCGQANRESIEKQHRIKVADLHRANAKQKALANQLKKTNDEQRDKIEQLQELLKQKEQRHFTEVYKADGKTNETPTDSIDDEVSQEDLIQISDLEKIGNQKEGSGMDVDAPLKQD
ncbi:unnamed protein product [Orchesella dallaii]|uniref:Uncharacterized protein n=1 Tax=Orchesella dallaii TaxID=48710 RepID=A0ABP1QA86_9HEXA